ncbi:MAG: methyltransferase domain-containing protein [Candidatus Paceibacterota bacterium]
MKILHIGGSHSIHLSDLVYELDKLGHKQCVFSYRKKSTLKNSIPVYYYPYDSFYPDVVDANKSACVRGMLKRIVEKEQPDLVHVHFIIVGCVPLLLLDSIKKLPVIVSPWNLRFMGSVGILGKRIRRSFEICDRVLFGSDVIFRCFQKDYQIHENRYSFYKLPLDLDWYMHSDVDCSCPKILSARVMQPTNHQDLLLYAIKKMREGGGDVHATFIVGQSREQGINYFNKMKALSRGLNIEKLCTFIDRSLSQDEFKKLIAKHNIVYSVSEDSGYSQTTIQSLCAGVVTLVRENVLEKNLADNNKNLLPVKLDVAGVYNGLKKAVDGLQNLCIPVGERNKALLLYDKSVTMPTLNWIYLNINKCKICGDVVRIEEISGHDLCICNACGVRYHRSTPSGRFLDNYYKGLSKRFGSIQKAINRNHNQNKKSFEVYVREVKENVPVGSRILDVGCYDGLLVKMLVDAGYLAEGIEINSELVRCSKKYGVNVTNCDISNFNNKFQYDTVISHAVLEHQPDPFIFIDKIKSVLSEGGTVIVSVPDSCRNFSVSYPAHLWHYTAHSLKILFNKCDMVCEVHPRQTSKSLVCVSKVRRCCVE